MSEPWIAARIDGSGRIRGEPAHVGAHLLSDRKRLLLADETVHPEQLAVIIPETVAWELLMGGAGDDRRVHGIGGEDREIPKDDTEILVILHQTLEVAQGALAVAAIVVEELDQRDRAFRIADDETVGRVDQGTAEVPERLLARVRLRHLLLCIELGDGVAQNLGVLHQVVLDDALDLGRLIRGELRRRDGRGIEAEQAAEREGDERSAQAHHDDQSFLESGSTRRRSALHQSARTFCL